MPIKLPGDSYISDYQYSYENNLESKQLFYTNNMVDNFERGYSEDNLLDSTITNQLGRSVKKGLGVTFKEVADGEALERISIAFRNIIGTNENVSKADISGNKNLLTDIELNSKRKFDTIFPSHIAISCNEERNKIVVKIPAFHLENSIKTPMGCTLLRFVNQVVTLSDYRFNALLNLYEPENVIHNSISAITPSDLISVDEEVVNSFELHCHLQTIQQLPKNVSLLCFVGIHFYQDVGYGCYKFAGESTFKLRQVF